MSKSPLRRNRRFERIAIPVLLVLLFVVLGRQLRAATSSNERCEVRVERVHGAHADRHVHRHVHDGHAEVDIDVARDVDVDVDARRVEIRIES